MVDVYSISKPKRDDGILLPMSIEQSFSSIWDTIYGLVIILGFCFITWLDLDSNYSYVLILTYIDLGVIFDSFFNIFIRGYQICQVVAVNKNVEALELAVFDAFYLLLELVACLPFISLRIYSTYPEAAAIYKCICVYRFSRLFINRRKFIGRSRQDRLLILLEEEIKRCRLNEITLKDTCCITKPEQPRSRKRLWTFDMYFKRFLVRMGVKRV